MQYVGSQMAMHWQQAVGIALYVCMIYDVVDNLLNTKARQCEHRAKLWNSVIQGDTY